MLQVHIDKLVFGGQGLGRRDNKVILAWNALPGEEVLVHLTKEKKNFAEGVAKEIIQPSPLRQKPFEDHFLSCSPWQVLSLQEECHWKKAIAREVYRKFGDLDMGDVEIETLPGQTQGYRNKIEYSFTEDAGQLCFAFFQRGGKNKQPIPHCLLATEAINATAQTILEQLREHNISSHQLKSLIVRSNSQGESCAGLFVTDENFPEIIFGLTPEFRGMGVYYSRGEHPASEVDRELYIQGQPALTENIGNIFFEYGVSSFFQVNVPAFTKVVGMMGKYFDPGQKVLDLYGGVGSLSLPLSSAITTCTIVDNNAQAIQYAQENIARNNVSNFTAIHRPSEKARDLITQEHTLILDPPRDGVHPKVVKKILGNLPGEIFYLSCNPATQARDLKLLLPKYQLTFHHLYNFFPRTPHIESLCILEKK